MLKLPDGHDGDGAQFVVHGAGPQFVVHGAVPQSTVVGGGGMNPATCGSSPGGGLSCQASLRILWVPAGRVMSTRWSAVLPVKVNSSWVRRFHSGSPVSS